MIYLKLKKIIKTLVLLFIIEMIMLQVVQANSDISKEMLKYHNIGKILLETPTFILATETTKYRRDWCFNKSGRDQANISLIHKVGRDYHIDLDGKFERVFETQIFHEIEKHCAPLRMVHVSNYIYGYIISSGTAYQYSDGFSGTERPLTNFFVAKDSSGFNYRKVRTGHSIGYPSLNNYISETQKREQVAEIRAEKEKIYKRKMREQRKETFDNSIAQQITIDPTLNGKVFLSGGQIFNTNQIIDAYNMLSNGLPLVKHKPMAFITDDGARYIVGIHKITKVFKILEFPVDEIEAIIMQGEKEILPHVQILDDLRKKFPAFELIFPEGADSLLIFYQQSPKTMRRIAIPLPDLIEKIKREYKL